MMLGGLSLYYECYDLATGERIEGKSMIDPTMQLLGSPYCADMTLECSEDPYANLCDGTSGDLKCKCMDVEMKMKVAGRRRRRIAIMGEYLMCETDNHCLSKKVLDNNMMDMVGPLDLFYECMDMETSKMTDALSFIEDRRRLLPQRRLGRTSYCADISYVCEDMKLDVSDKFNGCDNYLDDVEMMISCLKKEIGVLGARTDRLEVESVSTCTRTCTNVLEDIEKLLED